MTPMMKQYLEVKERYPDAILFFRLGDFYEMFLDDAVLASEILGIALTSRSGNKKKTEDGEDEERNPMCGVPYHAAQPYIAKLVSQGYKVAVCEQLEDPALAKGIVKRDVTKIITPGTVMDSDSLDEKSNNYLCAIYQFDKKLGVAFSDISTGSLLVTQVSDKLKLINELARYMPSEIILGKSAFDDKKLVAELEARFACLVEQAKEEPEWEHAREIILEQFKKENLSDAGLTEDVHIVNALGMLLSYLDSTQKIAMDHIREVDYYSCDDYMDIDVFTRRNLELTETMRSKNKKGSLLWVLDRTRTSMGGRLLRSFIEKPLVNCTLIQKRLYAVEELTKKAPLREDITECLKSIQDIERLIGKIVCKTANPRDLLALKQSLLSLPELELRMVELESPLLKEQCLQMDTLGDILELLEQSIRDECPISPKDGGVIKTGYDSEVDEYRDLAENGKSVITKIEISEREKTGIKSLRVGYNRVFGYYIEVSKSYKDQVPPHYIRKQTLVNGERYITEELKEWESKVLGADERVKSREYALFCGIRDKVAAEVDRVQMVADIVALLDVMCSFAEVAAKNNYVMPFVDMSDKIEIKDGRHPVVERMLKNELFVPNDTHLNCSQDRLLIITGPNMAGKSTYMRQVAVITLMAQIGSFVPASSCTIGVCDKIFTRVGASDDLSAGQSTFMVEMTEVSNILKNATNRSLLILDEIGRGTSTYDGLSIAWSVCEYVVDRKKIGARTLFATHYHELTELENKMEGVKNYCIACKKRGDDITFLRRIVKGGADDSYGIEVAALAGLPKKVIARAKEILHLVENQDARNAVQHTSPQEEEFQLGFEDVRGSEIAEIIETLDLSTLTPIEALNKLYELQNMAKK